MSEARVILLILAALLIREAWMLLPESDVLYYNVFPYYDMAKKLKTNVNITGIGAQTYVGFVCHYTFILLVVRAFWLLVTDWRDFIALLFAFQAVEFVDYFLTYNTAWFTFLGIGIGITIVKLASLSIVAIYKLWKT